MNTMPSGKFSKRSIGLLCAASLLASCADLRVAQDAYIAQDYKLAYKHWSDLAEKGFPEAEFRLAALYAEGHLGEKNIHKALEHFQRALETGHLNAARDLGRFLLRYGSRIKNTRSIIELLEEEARLGNSMAQLAIADIYLAGTLLPADVKKSITLLESLAMQENREAIERLGDLNRQGIHINADPVKARTYYQHAYKLGELNAGIKLASMLANGEGGNRNLEAAEEILLYIVKQGKLSAAFTLAQIRDPSNGEHPPADSINLYKQASDGGYVPARYRMADFYLRGSGVPQDLALAVEIFRDLSNKNYGPASARLGDLYRDGLYFQLDYAEALRHYEMAFQQGFARAELRIAKMYLNGFGVARDPVTARDIYIRYAADGDPDSAYGVAQSTEAIARQAGEPFPATAKDWYEGTYRAGHESGSIRLAEILYFGLIGKSDAERAFDILENLSESNSQRASMKLAELLMKENSPHYNPVLAIHYLEKAMQQGDGEARIKLADIHARLPGQDNEQKAIGIYRDLMTEGNIVATYKLARLYEQKLGEDAITTEILGWYRTARDAGYPPAQVRYADLQFEGIGIPQDIYSAITTYQELSSRGLGQATFRIGRLYESGISKALDYKTALKYYRLAYKQGYDLAELRIARFLAYGWGVQQDVETAISIFTRYYQQGNAKAAFELGEVYETVGSPLDKVQLQKARLWYKNALGLGYTDALFALAMVEERIHQQITDTSMQYLQRAVNNGHGEALKILGTRIFDGQHIPMNHTLGLSMLLSAARLNVSDALQIAFEKMDLIDSPQLIRTANKLSQEYMQATIGKAPKAADS